MGGIEEEEAAANFEVLLNILHFKTKQNFYTTTSYACKNQQNATIRRHNNGPSLVSDKIVSVDSLAEEHGIL